MSPAQGEPPQGWRGRSRQSDRWLPWLLLALLPVSIQAAPESNPLAGFGPYHVRFLEGGVGLSHPLDAHAPVLAGKAPWSMTTWLRITRNEPGVVVLAALGDPAAGSSRNLELLDGHLALSLHGHSRIVSAKSIAIKKWVAVSTTYDGTTARLYIEGREVASHPLETSAVDPVLNLAPVATRGSNAEHFGGALAHFRLHPQALSAQSVAKLATQKPHFELIVFHDVGVGWPLQQRAWRGLQEPQPAWTLPQSAAAARKPVAKPVASHAALEREPDLDVWTLSSWRMREAPRVSADGAQISRPGYADGNWYTATVPGTVLTTLIDRGVYPDPAYGLDNLAIPERLAHQDYWYRTQFTLPAELKNRELTLRFNGINYRARVWVNGEPLGEIAGAFTRGVFDVTHELVRNGPNAIAIRISPPPHPGIPHEESIAAGPGENGGQLALDGPTFIATEGWDWIPAMRDRDTGIWQSVELAATGSVRLLDPHVVTSLPLPRTDQADVRITLPLENRRASPARITIEARFADVFVRKRATVPPGTSEIELGSAEFPQLHLARPRLWWPNGYGPANLYTLTLRVREGGAISDTKRLRFGIRHITYELSLFDREGVLQRVEIDPTLAARRGERVVDVRHEAIKRTPRGWAASLTAAGESSPAVRPIASQSLSPYLAIRVNGVPIAARGGNWGLDDARKRISRERLEPYFRLHRAAHLNIIRNWLGQNTEDVFYDLADEYGLLVLNDFWISTQDFQLEPQDPTLFLANARDVISRYRNHPSIAVWFGRNEGVPPPFLNEALAALVQKLDGTRHYTGSSNNVNLQGSGPYNYRPPEAYFTTLAQGFSVEVGTPSLATLESLEATIPPGERWPPSDTLAYHDWHFGGNGDVATFMQTLARQFGPASSLADFERKAQMMNLVTYRAIFEGFNARLWTRNSGRLLWMTHPAWPSITWQIYSSDYDTHAAYYGVRKACEPVHAQMNLPDFRLAVVNTTREAHRDLTLHTRVISLDGRALASRTDRVDAPANAVTTLAPLPLAPLLAKEHVVLVELNLTDSQGAIVSTNTYWQGLDDQSYRRLNDLPRQRLRLRASLRNETEERVIVAELSNEGRVPALAAKLTLFDAQGRRILPALYSDNYITLLPGEKRRVEVRFPAASAAVGRLALRGWNIEATSLSLAQ